MLIKRAAKTCANGLLPSFKTSVTYRSKFSFTSDNCVPCEASFSDITQFFVKNRLKTYIFEISVYFLAHL